MMKSKTIRFAVFTVSLIVTGYICLSGFSVKKYPDEVNSATTASFSALNPDTLPAVLNYKSYDTLPFNYRKLKTNDTAASLLKRLGNVFKFKKFAKFNEKNRVIDLLNQLHIGDSIVATQQNVAFLNRYLTDTVNQNINSLKSLVYFLQRNDENLYADIDYLQSSQADLEKKMAILDEYKLQYDKIGQDKYANKTVSDKDLNILASKIFPIVSVYSDIQEVTEKMGRINILKNIRDSLKILREITETDGSKKYYSVGIKNKIEVYGYYNYFSKGRVETGNLGYINTLIYNGLYIHSNTGDIKDLNGWDTSTMVTNAQKAGCSVALTFAIADPTNVNAFLTNRNAPGNFINTAINLMKYRKAYMINISFGNFNFDDSGKFLDFIKKFNRILKQEDTGYKLLLTVPAMTAGNYYPLSELATIADRFIIDFSTNYSSQASPLASMPALNEVIPFFIKSKVLPEKIVVCLPYHGVKWATIPFYPNREIEYISYTLLRNNYLFPGYINYLDEVLVTSVMDSVSVKKDTVRRIFYDDESTLSVKYNFILENAFKGVAVNALGEDYGYNSLWDEMLYAFAVPDTNYISDIPKRKLVKEEGLGFFQKLYRMLTLYNHILQNPCEICFENIKDSVKRELMEQYLLDLDIFKKVKAENAERVKNGETPYRSRFQFVNDGLTDSIFVTTIIFVIILLVLGLVYFLKSKSNGDHWNGKKLTGRLILADSVLIVLFTFTFLFCNDNIAFFGSAASDKPGFSQNLVSVNNTPVIDSSPTRDYCIKDPDTKCINMPLHTLLGIIILGLVVGGILTRYLLLPLIKRYEKP